MHRHHHVRSVQLSSSSVSIVTGIFDSDPSSSPHCIALSPSYSDHDHHHRQHNASSSPSYSITTFHGRCPSSLSYSCRDTCTDFISMVVVPCAFGLNSVQNFNGCGPFVFTSATRRHRILFCVTSPTSEIMPPSEGDNLANLSR